MMEAMVEAMVEAMIPSWRARPSIPGLTPFFIRQELLRPAITATIAAADLEVFLPFFAWAEGFLCQPHPALGRAGPVCPYSRGSLDAALFFVALYRGGDGAAGPMAAIRAAAALWRDHPPADPAQALLQTMLVLLPELAPGPDAAVIDAVHDALALEFAEAGLMLGDFYPSSLAPGLHNRDFRPLRAPLALLGVRAMVLGDLPFLVGSPAKIDAYLARFGEPGRRALALHRGATRSSAP